MVVHPGDPLLLPRPCFPNLVDLIDPNGLPLVPLAAGEEGGKGDECLVDQQIILSCPFLLFGLLHNLLMLVMGFEKERTLVTFLDFQVLVYQALSPWNLLVTLSYLLLLRR